MSSAKIL